MKRISQTAWNFPAMAAGIAFGAIVPAPARHMALPGSIFLRLIKSVLAPLLFGAAPPVAAVEAV